MTSNYVYHNITGADKRALLRESLRVLKRGGVFAIHDLMEPSRYGDMDEFPPQSCGRRAFRRRGCSPRRTEAL